MPILLINILSTLEDDAIARAQDGEERKRVTFVDLTCQQWERERERTIKAK